MTGSRYHLASSVTDAVTARRRAGAEALFVAGGTALQLGWEETFGPPALVDVSRLGQGVPCRVSGDHLELCAFASLESVRRDPLVAERFPSLATALAAIAAFGVRSLGTLGGNLAWTNGDLRPLVLAADAVVVTSEGEGSVAHWLADRDPHALLLSVRVPPSAAAVCFEKVGFRAAFSPSRLTLAFTTGAAAPRVAAGGGGNATGRLRRAEAVLASRARPEVACWRSRSCTRVCSPPTPT